AAWLVERGMKTLPLRIERHNANAREVANWALTRREFQAVHWPGLEQHPDHATARAMLAGFGGLVGLQLDGAAAAARLCARLEMIVHAPSLAGVESLISEPRLTSHAGLTAEQRTALGIPDGFLRLSCGCEDARDIIRDLEQALS